MPMEPGATLSLWSSNAYGPGRYALALGLQARSVALPGAEASAGEVKGSASYLELLGTVGLMQRLDVSGAVALERLQLSAPGSEESPEGSSELGDVRVAPRLRVLGDSGSGLAFVVPTWRPGGAGADRAVRVEPRLAASLELGALTALINVGYRLHPGAPRLGVGSSAALTGGAGAEVGIADSWALLGEVLGVWSEADRELEGARGASGEARLGARYADSGWAAQFGAGRGVLGGAGEPDWRLIASVSFSPAGEPPIVAPAPVQIASVEEDDDADYLKDEPDWQPPEDAAPAADASGASEPAPERESASTELVPGSPPAGTLESDEPDGAAEYEAAAHDAAAGFDGAIVSIPEVEIQAAELERHDAPLPRITEVIRFAPNQMRLDAAQQAQLDIVAEQMSAAPRDAELVVCGHSDSSGPSGFNWRLSRMRASTVRYHLMQRGIPWQRISVRAYGASRPAARGPGGPSPSQNRRVEFQVIRAGHPLDTPPR